MINYCIYRNFKHLNGGVFRDYLVTFFSFWEASFGTFSHSRQNSAIQEGLLFVITSCCATIAILTIEFDSKNVIL